MIQIRLNAVGKQFEEKWIFKNISLLIEENAHLAVTGLNGAGKSTFLQLLSAYSTPTTGSIDFLINSKVVEPAKWYKYIAFAAPYIDFPEDLTLKENFNFYKSYKKIQNNFSLNELAEIAFLNESIDKPVKNFSSGMKQRLKLALTITTDLPLLLLDEPLSNLDQKGIDWFGFMISEYAKDKMVVICSNNQKEEIACCTSILNINDFHVNSMI